MKKITVFVFLISLFLTLSTLSQSLPGYAAEHIGNLIELYGGYVKAESAADVSPSAFTFEAWVKPVTVTGKQIILSIGEKESSKLHYEVSINGGGLQFNYRYGLGSQKLISAGNIRENIWNHIAVSVSHFDTLLYINGRPVYGTAGASELLPIGSNIVLGRQFTEVNLASNIFQGAIDEVRISKSARDIQALWNAGTYDNSLTSDSPTVVLWRMDEVRGETVAHDLSGSSINGILVGGDEKIHFYGILPTSTPAPSRFTFPTISLRRPALPTLSFPRATITSGVQPTATPILSDPTPTPWYNIRAPREPRTTFH